MATELHVAFPQFSLDAIIGVVETEKTSEAAAIKLIEMDDERNRMLAEQYHAATMKHLQQQVAQKAAKVSPPAYSKEPEVEIVLPPPEPDFPPEQDYLAMDNEAKLTVVVDEPEVSTLSPASAEASIPVDNKPDYSDWTCPAVDLLLRGFGGREKNAPEKSTEHSLPASNVEEGLKENIKTTDTPSQGITPAQDLAARKEARRKARRDRRERQQQQREALSKATALQTQSRRNRRGADGRKLSQTETHLTSHTNKDKLLPSQSTPAINTECESSDPFKMPAFQSEYSDDITSSMISITEEPNDKMVSSRNAGSSGYDTGSEWYLDQPKDNPDVRPKQREPPNQDDEEKYEGKLPAESPSSAITGVKFKCGPKYETVSKSGRVKPSKYESKKSKKYGSRRKTLNFDHYSTDYQDRSSM